jgi:DNA-binding SARP family transcriptional activator
VVDGEAREERLHGRQGRLALAFLVLNRARPVRRDELVEAIWSGDGAAPGDNALSPVLSRLRRALAPATIDGRAALELVLPQPVWIDLETAQERLALARAASAPADALAAAREAAGLVEGGLLPGVEAPWLEGHRSAMEDLRIEALELVARTGAPEQAESAARAVLALAPFRESAWAALIGALRDRGNVAEALRAYEEMRRLLDEELGAVPGSELLSLHGELLTAPRRAPAPATAAPADLLERELELGEVDAALHRTAGGVLLIEGPAGIGKTRLLSELQDRAQDGWRVYGARASLLEREYGFGVVRQLFEGVDPAVLVGPAAPARAVLDDAGVSDGTFPVLAALFRLVEKLAGEGPLLLCVDDLQWSDPASLRFVAYLARRLAPVQVLLAATVRTGDPDADDALLGEIAGEPHAVSLRPRPLTGDATARLVRERMGEDAAAAFTDACQDVTAGNPLLVRQLVSALAAEGVTPDAAHAEAVLGIGPRAVARTVLLRLVRMPDPSVAVARAIAVLGEAPALAAVAAHARTDEPTAAEAIQALARAEIIRAEEPLGFVHPLVRDAVYGALPGAARALEHERAARLLAELGAPPERVAAQLLLAPGRGDAWVVARLREAAAVALRRGAPDAAMALLERAQAEPPPPEQQAELALELGGSAAYLRGPAGVEPLQRAYAELTDPEQRGRAAVRLSHLLLFVRSPQEGVEVANQAAAELPEDLEDLHHGLRAVRLVGAAFGAVDPAEFRALDDVRRGPRGDGPGARALTAMTALAVALTCGPAEEASALAREAFAGEGLAAFELTAPVALGTAALALGDPAEGLVAIARYAEHARRQGEVLGSIGADLWGGIVSLWAGDIDAAMSLLEHAHEGERLWGTKLDAVMAYSAAWTALARLERGDPPDQVEATLHRIEAHDPRPDGARFWLASAAEIALAAGRPEEALEISRRLEPARPADTHPVWAPWRTLRARALLRLGDPAEARRLAAEELALARLIGAPWVIGRGLRLLAEIEGADGVEHAREAVAHLAGGPARLELAKAHLALAAALRDAGEAASERRMGLALAAACGARGLAAG